MSARLVYTGFKSAPFRTVVDEAPIGDQFQQLIDRCENPDRVMPQVPAQMEAAPELEARRRERMQFADTVAEAHAIEPNDDDDAWCEPGEASCVAVWISVFSAATVLAALGWGLYLMTKVG